MNPAMTDLRLHIGKEVCYVRCCIATDYIGISFPRELGEYARSMDGPVFVVCLEEPKDWYRREVSQVCAAAIWYNELPRLPHLAQEARKKRQSDPGRNNMSSTEPSSPAAGAAYTTGQLPDDLTRTASDLRQDGVAGCYTGNSDIMSSKEATPRDRPMTNESSEFLLFEGRNLRVSRDAFLGSVDNANATRNGVSFTAWAISNRSPSNVAKPPAAFLIVANGMVIINTAPNSRRPDISDKFGPDAIACGLKIELTLDQVPMPFVPDFTFYAFDGHDCVCVVPFFTPNNHLRDAQIKSGSDFMRLIQTPSTRLSDAQTLAYVSAHCLNRLPGDYSIRAAALCVIGYRILNGEVSDSSLEELFWVSTKVLLSETPQIERGLFARWHTSVRLIAGYLAFQAKKDDEAIIHFEAVTNFFIDLPHWPQLLTNVLLGFFISGYLRNQNGEQSEALLHWSKGADIFRFGCSIAQFQNYYAYGELGNALRVVTECYTGMQVIKGNGPINNPAIAPLGLDIDLAKLPSPLGRLVSQRNRVLH
jgi:hypothetical protein